MSLLISEKVCFSDISENVCFSDRHMHNVSRMDMCRLSDPRKSVCRIDPWHRITLWNPRKFSDIYIYIYIYISLLSLNWRSIYSINLGEYYTWILPVCSPLKNISVWDWGTDLIPLKLCTLKNKHISIKERYVDHLEKNLWLFCKTDVKITKK